MLDKHRLTTGIKGLDQILAGGLVTGASYIIQGLPGAGKTILSNQISYNHIVNGGRVLYVTLLSESHERLFQTMDELAFFDRSRLGGEITYISVFQTLRDDGLDAVVRLLRSETKRQAATLLVFDGLLNARDHAATEFDIKTFVAEVQGQAAFVDCTVLFLSSSKVQIGPEHTMVDGVIELKDTLTGVRSMRHIHVRKSRGSVALPGLHKFEITNDGVTVYPRIETLPLIACPLAEGGRVSTGVPAIDELIGGGLPRGTVTLIAGPTGSGKTTMGLHFLSHCSNAEPGMHFGFFETPQRLRGKASALNIDLGDEQQGPLIIDWRPMADNILDKLAHELLETVQTKGIKRLFLDGLGGFERAAIDRNRLIEFFAGLMEQLRVIGVTTLATWELREMIGADVLAPARDVSAILDNMILLRRVEQDYRLVRSIAIQKMRDSDFDPTVYELTFGPNGLMVGSPLNSLAHAALPPDGGQQNG